MVCALQVHVGFVTTDTQHRLDRSHVGGLASYPSFMQ